MEFMHPQGKLNINKNLWIMLQFRHLTMQVWSTDDNNQDDEEGKGTDDDGGIYDNDDIYHNQMVTCDAKGSGIIGPYENESAIVKECI